MQDNPQIGAQALVKCLENEGVECVFGLPGGSAIPLYDAILDSKIKLILTRHEQGATHMADGYARATGKPGVVIVTSGPGATNTITGLFTAQMDSIPMVVITGQSLIENLGKDAFQESDIFDISMPVVKHSYLLKSSADVPRVVKEAFHICNTGRPGPVLIDIPKDVSTGEVDLSCDVEMDLPGYTIPSHGDKEDIQKIADALAVSKKPLLLVGHGAVIARASNEVRELAEKLRAPVTNTLLGKGAFPESHELSVGMLGMHGTAYANMALHGCDLVFSIGSRWDDRINGDNDRFCPDAVKIHVDIDPAEIGKIVKPDISVVGDAKLIIDELNKLVSPMDTAAWLKDIKSWKKKFPLSYKKQGGLKAQHIMDTMCRLAGPDAVIVTDVGQHQMWAAQFFKVDKSGNWLSSGGAGTMGFGFPAAIGAQVGQPDKCVIAVVGDGGFQMTLPELATAAVNKLPVKVLVFDNRYLGMVRQWQDMFYDNRLSGVDLTGNPDFVKLAESYGVKGFRIKRSADVDKVLAKALEYNDGPCLIHAEIHREDNVFPMVPAGKFVDNMIITPTKEKLEKPKGST